MSEELDDIGRETAAMMKTMSSTVTINKSARSSREEVYAKNGSQSL